MGETSGSSTHDLLLALAGQVDDDLLAWARELVAVGENTRAIALVTAGITADRTALPASLRAALVTAARTARTDLDADAALPGATDTASEHRFVAAPAGCDERVATAVATLPARLLDGAEVLLAWRLTPAGSAPGPLPHPVVLVDVEPGGRPADVLAYQLSVALDRSGVVASVEVLTSGDPLSAYHAAARGAALRIDGPVTASPVEPVEPVAAPEAAEPAAAATPPAEPAPPVPGYADLWAAEGPFAVPAEPAGSDATATDPTGDVVRDITQAPRPLTLRPAREPAPDEPESRPAPRTFERRRTTVTPLTRSSLPSPVPLVRRDGSRLRPLVPVTDETARPDAAAGDEPAAAATDPQRAVRPSGDALSSLAQGQIPAFADTPMFRSMHDPLSGPLSAPLLAPLLDPTPFAERGAPAGDEEDDDPFGLHGVSPLAPDLPAPGLAPVEDGWAREWASGDWTLSSSELRSTAPEPPPLQAAALQAAAAAPGRDAVPDEGETPRHRAATGPAEQPPAPPVTEPPAAPAAPSRSPEPQRRAGPPATGPRPHPGRAPAARTPDPSRERASEGLGLRPDSVARLTDADRELLARLQAELGTGARPRAPRRSGAGTPNGTAPNGTAPNGTAPNGTAPNGSAPNGSATHRPAPNGNGPNGNGPNRNGPDRNGPDRNGTGRHDPPDLAG